MKWRVAQNPYNTMTAPWTGAIAIEEDIEEDDDLAFVPSIVAWTTRGWDNPEEIAALLASAPALKEALKAEIEVMEMIPNGRRPHNYDEVIRKCREALP